MKKEKFHIVMPDEETIQTEIRHIVANGIVLRKSFSKHLKTIYMQIGFKNLFFDRLNSMMIILTILASMSYLALYLNSSSIQEHDLYVIIFLISPIAFLLFSMCNYVSKVQNNTFEVEMACQFNVFQVIAIKMLFYSIVSILMNTFFILLMVVLHHDIEFIRAMMISITSLFIFSSIFLYALMKKRIKGAVLSVIVGWLLGNVMILLISHELYMNLLLHVPFFVYGIVLFCSIVAYLKSIKKLFYIKPAEGAY